MTLFSVENVSIIDDDLLLRLTNAQNERFSNLSFISNLCYKEIASSKIIHHEKNSLKSSILQALSEKLVLFIYIVYSLVLH